MTRRIVLIALVVASAVGVVTGLGSARPAAAQGAPTPNGYWFVGADGGVFSFGGASYYGSMGGKRLNRPIVTMASTPTGKGYWLVASDGGVFAFGDAAFAGSTGSIPLNKPIVAMASTPTGKGYWLVASDGGVFAFGDADFKGSAGSTVLNKPIVTMAATPTGGGYWLVASDGGVFSYGDAVFRGSAGSVKLNKPIVGMATTPSGRGYWLVASDGGVFSYGNATFLGSMGASPLNKPVIALAASPRGLGYWMVASDGGIFTFGDAAFAGSTGDKRLNSGIVAMAAAPVRTTHETAVFFYPWYATLAHDGQWQHWVGNGHIPPDDIPSNYFPARGLYSSSDPLVLDAQMTELAAAGVDLVVSSWWGRGSYEDSALPRVQAAAAAHGIRVAVHLEPYAGRSLDTIGLDVVYLRTLGIRDVWLYAIQNFRAADLAATRATMGSDVRVMGESSNPTSVKSGSFAAFARSAGLDGIYTYDAVRYGPADFATVCATARDSGLLCSPSASPGYVAFRAKPTDTQNVPRDGGARYDATWKGAVDGGADIVSITSYNEWHEGTQLEGALSPHCFPDGLCSSGYDGAYGLSGVPAQGAYLARTATWSTMFHQR
ncbi:MAG TPA: hypothetical protein VFJ85_07435 [Acidimicrobiales bacterium]|nr:hypothetical protein [Acidimicrobiales bacterium]